MIRKDWYEKTIINKWNVWLKEHISENDKLWYCVIKYMIDFVTYVSEVEKKDILLVAIFFSIWKIVLYLVDSGNLARA